MILLQWEKFAKCPTTSYGHAIGMSALDSFYIFFLFDSNIFGKLSVHFHMNDGR